MPEIGRFPVRRVLVWGGLAVLAAALSGLHIVAVLNAAPEGAVDLRRVVLTDTVLPRIAVALGAGAALGLSGHLLQRILRNPLAEPSTLGIAAGAQLALATATLILPAWIATAREVVAMAGATAAVAVLLALTWRRRLEPVAVALAGLMLSMIATMGAAALILANGEYLFALFIWGGGSLVQQGWGPALAIALRLAGGALVAALLLRPLSVMALDEDGARGLGAAVVSIRLAVLAVAVWLAAGVTAEVGVLGFVGLAAPTLARLGGARGERARLITAPLIGALLLWLADGLVQASAGPFGERVPTGAATALLGGPLLLWLLPRLRLFEWPMLAQRAVVMRRLHRPLAAMVLLAGGLTAMIVLALLVGAGADGWAVADAHTLGELLPWRGPRVVIAVAAGAMLAAAGCLLQRITANPLAGPEVLGIGSGAGIGLAAALFLLPAPGSWERTVAAACGALATLGLILTLARRGGMGPERLLLAGLAVAASAGAGLAAAIAPGSRESIELLRWLAGSIDGAGAAEAWFAAGAAAVLLAPLPALRRALRILPLGDGPAQALGLAVGRWRGLAVVLAGLLTAAASVFVGPLSFIGLMAPHVARRLGFDGVLTHVAAAALIGAALMTASDLLARLVAFPYQLPLGLFASVIGGAYLIARLSRD